MAASARPSDDSARRISMSLAAVATHLWCASRASVRRVLAARLEACRLVADVPLGDSLRQPAEESTEEAVHGERERRATAGRRALDGVIADGAESWRDAHPR